LTSIYINCIEGCSPNSTKKSSIYCRTYLLNIFSIFYHPIFQKGKRISSDENHLKRIWQLLKISIRAIYITWQSGKIGASTKTRTWDTRGKAVRYNALDHAATVNIFKNSSQITTSDLWGFLNFLNYHCSNFPCWIVISFTNCFLFCRGNL
jgi:hypothetical protein